MSMKDTILAMPAWKAVVCTILLILCIGVVTETILVHTVFHFFDRVIFKMESEQKQDIDDLNSIAK